MNKHIPGSNYMFAYIQSYPNQSHIWSVFKDFSLQFGKCVAKASFIGGHPGEYKYNSGRLAKGSKYSGTSKSPGSRQKKNIERSFRTYFVFVWRTEILTFTYNFAKVRNLGPNRFSSSSLSLGITIKTRKR